MIHDLDRAERVPEYDVCVVGSGPAGTTVAKELLGSGLRVAVLESGRLAPTKLGDALRRVRSEGIRIKDYSRERVLGGASTTWAGLSSPLDEIDFRERGFLRASGWPIARATLLPLWGRAAERYRFAALPLFGAEGFGALKRKGDAQLAWSDLEEKIFLAASEPQNWGTEHRAVYEGEEIDLWLDATVLRLEAGGVAGRVTRAVARSTGGREHRVDARVFVIATGGIENARLLLASRDLCAAGLGNERDQVGRWLMNHPKNYFGTIRPARSVRELPYHFGCLHKGYAGYAGLRLREELQEERRVLNSYVRFEPLFPWSDNEGVESFVLFVKRSRGLFRAWKESKKDEVVTLRDYSETGDDTDLQNERKDALGWMRLAGNVVVNALPVGRYVAARLRRRAAAVQAVRLRNFMEMEPNPENRVLLGDATDAYGQPETVVRHQSTELDRRSMVEVHRALAADLARNGFGRLEGDLAGADPWPIDLDASHHMGTTRMGVDPATSVVDADCRLHEVENVFVAGASVFPTSGCANPTFTLVALAIRLAGHLRERVLAGAPAPAREEPS